MNLSIKELTAMIDHTILKQFISNEDLKKHCQIAIEYGFETVCVNGCAVSFCKEIIGDYKINCNATVGFPLGQSTIETKVFETIDAIEKGAKEIDYVINVLEVKNGNWSYIKDEMTRIVTVCKENNAVCKVIFENCFLTTEEKKKLCKISLEVMPTYIKTSTGFGTGGATIEDVKLMKNMVGNSIKIKASGGIRTIEDALTFIEAGADRIGTSCGVEIVEGYKKIII